MYKSLFFLLGLISINLNAQTFTLKSNDIDGQATMKQVFDGFGCTGSNLSPQLYWENAPKETKSFAVTIHDQDAPTGSGWWHWVIFDISNMVSELKTGAGNLTKNSAPTESIQSMTDFGKPGYGGPCPPEGHGYHKYTVTVYALKTEKLGLDKNANPALVGYYLSGNVIEKSSIVFYYKR
jgi:Raf kinase inhibitor-like YbhB/YbcL family protein